MSDPDIVARVSATRADLERTLDAIEDKLNVPKRVAELTDRGRESYEKSPLPWVIGAAVVAVSVVSLVAWALLSSDD